MLSKNCILTKSKRYQILDFLQHQVQKYGSMTTRKFQNSQAQYQFVVGVVLGLLQRQLKIDCEVKLFLLKHLNLLDQVGQGLVATLVRLGPRLEIENESRQVLELGSRLGHHRLEGVLITGKIKIEDDVTCILNFYWKLEWCMPNSKEFTIQVSC